MSSSKTKKHVTDIDLEAPKLPLHDESTTPSDDQKESVGGRHLFDEEVTERMDSSGDSRPSHVRRISMSRRLSYLPAVDGSEGGWATDNAASLIASLFLISSILFRYDHDGNDLSLRGIFDNHWAWMYLGTAIAHLFGGLGHRFFPNRAHDGEGLRGFYLMMTLGYGGNCIRYGLGWGIGGWVVRLIALANFVLLAAAGLMSAATLRVASDRYDFSRIGFFLPDACFGYLEVFCAAMEVSVCIAYIAMVDNQELLLYVVVGSNLAGWCLVYVMKILSYCRRGFVYNEGTVQRLFHFAMIVMVWSINEYEVAMLHNNVD